MSERRTVWVIEQGEYSDYHIVGVFSSQENARLVYDAINPEHRNDYNDPAEPVEWPLDPAVMELRVGLRLFRVFMLRDGTVEDCRLEQYDGSELVCNVIRRSYRARPEPDLLHVELWAKDVQQAIKAANEKRAMMIANNEWPVP